MYFSDASNVYNTFGEHSLNAWSDSFYVKKTREREREEIGKQSFVGKYVFTNTHTHIDEFCGLHMNECDWESELAWVRVYEFGMLDNDGI